MATFDEFYAHYDLNADTLDSRLQFKQYKAAYQTLMAAAGMNDHEKPTKPNEHY